MWNIRDPLLEGGLPGSGLAAYSVQVCLDNQPCQNLISNPGLSGTHFFEGNPDHTYTFRVWAKDRVDHATTEEQSFNTASVTKYYLFGS
ncbi:MAG: hypothetical protein Fur0022_32370 [Anaerolineales bacterium]